MNSASAPSGTATVPSSPVRTSGWQSVLLRRTVIPRKNGTTEPRIGSYLMAMRSYLFEVFERLEENRKRQDEHQNKNKRKAPEFKVGEKVLLKISNFTSDGTTNKLKEKFKGPFTVTRVMGNDRYEVKEDLGSERCSRSRRYVGVAAVENMKPFVVRSDDIL
ncbi:unnamed protein product [Callosobruchus maculatus]|uniref:Uncharacterized protein n=1 Tax=Callosobruchus maculatus TaxID=64391 RepID=A0A653CTE3_CALMS|nr:unnamed protein product [Callosobruchus maculatus]